jgi:prepilin peptidase CpaA
MDAVALHLFAAILIAAAAGDAMTRRIPNLLVGACAVSFVPFAWAAGFPAWMFLEHAATAVVLLLLGYALFCFGYLGAGDAKFMAAIGLWLGVAPSVLFVLLSAVAGGVLSAAVGLWFMLHLHSGIHIRHADRVFRALRPDVPYGFALAAGAILAIPYSWLTIATASG